MAGIDKAQAERVARVYKPNKEAAGALGINPRSFARLCKRLAIETPTARSKRVRGGG
jgi:hypothetical protein